jgi:hypothetical protein
MNKNSGLPKPKGRVWFCGLPAASSSGEEFLSYGPRNGRRLPGRRSLKMEMLVLIISKHTSTIASSKYCGHCRVKTKINPETHQKRKLRYPGSGFIYMTTTVKYQPNSTATASPMTDSKFCSC